MRKITVTENQGNHRFLAFLPFAMVLLISTSYQQFPDDLHFGEEEYYSPAVRYSLKNYLISDTLDNLISCDSGNNAAHEFLRNFYAYNGYTPIWTDVNGLKDRTTDLVYFIEHAQEYGLEPQNYHFDAIGELIKSNLHKANNQQDRTIDVDLELLLTDAAFRLMINIHAGYQPFDSALYATDWVKSIQNILLHGISDKRIVECILSCEPEFTEYKKLRKANRLFVRKNLLNDQAGMISYPNKDTVRLMNDISKVLLSLGFLESKGSHADYTAALQKFQRYHGLIPDGKPGLNTIEALNKSTLYKYRVLALNLDRLRKYHFSDSTQLYINIPAYSLKIIDDNCIRDTFRIIVGSPATPTPVLSGNLEKIIANPVWFVPRSIAINEMLPKIKSDSNYLKKNGIQILDRSHNPVNSETIDLSSMSEEDFNYIFRQNRGSDNSLGQVKFIFNNPYAVYLHDTPGKDLFAKDLRAFSHGCIRVEHPDRLASYILTAINADTTNIANLISSGRQHEFMISSRLPIHITYVTCEADDEGGVYFYKDIYGIDNKELANLNLLMGN